MYLLVPKVASLVITHVPLRSEALTTILRTRIRQLVLMDSLVNLEVIFLAEGLAAGRKGTLVRLCPIMNMHVGLKANLT